MGEGGRAEGTRLKKENVETEISIITELKGEKIKEKKWTEEVSKRKRQVITLAAHSKIWS